MEWVAGQDRFAAKRDPRARFRQGASAPKPPPQREEGELVEISGGESEEEPTMSPIHEAYGSGADSAALSPARQRDGPALVVAAAAAAPPPPPPPPPTSQGHDRRGAAAPADQAKRSPRPAPRLPDPGARRPLAPPRSEPLPDQPRRAASKARSGSPSPRADSGGRASGERAEDALVVEGDGGAVKRKAEGGATMSAHPCLSVPRLPSPFSFQQITCGCRELAALHPQLDLPEDLRMVLCSWALLDTRGLDLLQYLTSPTPLKRRKFPLLDLRTLSASVAAPKRRRSQRGGADGDGDGDGDGYGGDGDGAKGSRSTSGLAWRGHVLLCGSDKSLASLWDGAGEGLESGLQLKRSALFDGVQMLCGCDESGAEPFLLGGCWEEESDGGDPDEDDSCLVSSAIRHARRFGVDLASCGKWLKLCEFHYDDDERAVVFLCNFTKATAVRPEPRRPGEGGTDVGSVEALLKNMGAQYVQDALRKRGIAPEPTEPLRRRQLARAMVSDQNPAGQGEEAPAAAPCAMLRWSDALREGGAARPGRRKGAFELRFCAATLADVVSRDAALTVLEALMEDAKELQPTASEDEDDAKIAALHFSFSWFDRAEAGSVTGSYLRNILGAAGPMLSSAQVKDLVARLMRGKPSYAYRQILSGV